MALIVPIHGQKVHHLGRVYQHMPSPVRKSGASDTILMKVHRAQSEPYLSKARYRVVVAGRRWGKCLAPGTLIQMSDGSTKPVENVIAGDHVLTLNEDTYALESNAVQHLHDNGVKDTMRVSTAYRSITGTPNHPVLANNEWKELQSVKVGDLLAVPKRLPFGNISIDQWKVDFLAIWLAEGCGSHISNGTPEILDILRAALDTAGCDLVHIDGVDWRWRCKDVNSGHTMPSKLIKELGLRGRDSKTKFIPECIFQLPPAQLARFLNLFFACDGCITGQRLEVGLANEKMVGQIADLLHRFGIRGTIRHKIHSACSSVTGKPFESWVWRTSDPDSIHTFSDEIGCVGKGRQLAEALHSAKSSRGNCNIYLPISYEAMNGHLPATMPSALLSELKSWRQQNRSRISVRRYLKIRPYSDGFFDPLLLGDIAWEEVTNIETAGPQSTYDLTVANNHNFIANGIVTHNTHWICVELLQRAAEAPKQKVWYVAPTYSMAKQIAWEKLKEIIPLDWIARKAGGGLRINETSLKIWLVNGSTIELKGADRPDTLRGVGVNFLALDEYQDFKAGIWEAVLRATLSDTLGSAVFIGTPKSFNHLYEMYKRGQGKNPQWKSWQFKTSDSPFIAPGEIRAARGDMDSRTFKQEYEASFESMSGRVYYDFSRIHNVRPSPYDPSLPMWVGQDFNVDPMSTVLMQLHGEQLWAVGEVSLKGSNTEEVCRELFREYGFGIKDIATVYPDPAGASRSTARGDSDIQIFREWGFNRILYKKKHPPVRDRIAATNRLVCDAAGHRRFFVDPSCKELIKCYEQLTFKPGTNDPDKSLNIEHMGDAAGYAIDYEFPIRKSLQVAGYSR